MNIHPYDTANQIKRHGKDADSVEIKRNFVFDIIYLKSQDWQIEGIYTLT